MVVLFGFSSRDAFVPGINDLVHGNKKEESFLIKKELIVVKSPLMHLEITLNSKIRRFGQC